MFKNFKLKIKNLLSKPLHRYFFYLLILFLPTQLGLHPWPSWSFVNGLAIDYLSPTIYLTDILIFLTLFFWLLPSIFHRLQPSSIFYPLSSNKSLVVPVVLVVLFILFSFFYLNPLAHLFKLLKLLELYLLFLYVKHNFVNRLIGFSVNRSITMQPFNHVAILLSIGIVFESFLSILQFLTQHSLGGIFYFFGERSFNSSTPGIAQAIIDGKLILRPYGTFSHPNSLAGYFLAALFLILVYPERSEGSLRGAKPRSVNMNVAKRRSNLHKYLFLFTFYLLLLTLFISFSRSAWFVAGLTFFTIGLLNIKKLLIILKQKYILPVVLVVLVVPVILFSRPFISRLESITTTDSQSYQKRADLNQLAINMFLSSPLIGVGLNNFIPNLPRFTENQPQVRFYQPVHNIYLLILAESGLLGFSVFMFIIYKMIKTSLRGVLFCRTTKQSAQQIALISPYLYIFISFVSILLLGLFDHYSLTLQQNQLLVAIVLALLFSQNKNLKRYN